MKNTRIDLSIPLPTFFLLFLSLALALHAAGPAHAGYGMQGSFSVNTEGGTLITRNIPWGEQVDISDSDTSVGGEGNTATAGYSASITNASISGSASAQNALHAPGDFWSSDGGTVTNLQDDLRFTIPAGDYPSGVHAVARVHVEGSLTVTGGATAQHEYSVQFGETVHVTTPAPAPPVSEDIELTAELVSPGTTLNNPTTRLAQFIASLDIRASTPGEVAQTSAADLSCQVTCIVVSPGVTWVSDSGAFGAETCVAAAPGLASWAAVALALALIGTALWIARRQRRAIA